MILKFIFLVAWKIFMVTEYIHMETSVWKEITIELKQHINAMITDKNKSVILYVR